MKRSIQRRAFIREWMACIMLLCAMHVGAQQLNNVHLRSASIQMPANASTWLQEAAQKPSSTEPIQVLILFANNPTEAQKTILEKAGVTLLNYISNGTYSAIVHYPVVADAIGQLPIQSVQPVQAEWKADTYLWRQIAAQTRGSVEVLVSFYPQIDAKTCINYIQQAGGQIVPNSLQDMGVYKVQIAGAAVRSMANWYGVKHIDRVSGYVDLDVEARDADKANVASLAISYGGYGLLGDGMAVGVGDNGSGMYHADTRDRVIDYNPIGNVHHGAHINGIVGSAGIIDPLAEGMAPHVNLVDHLYDNVWTRTATMLQAHNMTITNNSYAVTEGECNSAGTYDINAQMLDAVSQQNNTVLHVFAAGNDGNLTCGPYPAGFGTVPGGYQCSKNVLVVTSTDKGYQSAYDASHGPIQDGRLKPDMSAVGYGVYSDIGVDTYEYASGTSMASPNTAGALALLAERYKQLFGNVNPRADLLKALILNGTTDIGNPGPDFKYGFGSLNLVRSLQILDSNRYILDSVSTGAQKNLTIYVPDNTAQLKVMLYWHDAPADLMSAHQLVNDLDLSVIDPVATLHRPLVLDTIPANVNNNAVEGIDRINNCEQVILNNPTAGNYTLKVAGYYVPSGNQPFVVAYDMIPVGMKITFPTGGIAVPANKLCYVYWDASDDNNGFSLQYSTNNGSSWITIDNNIPANQKYYIWTVPNVSSNQGKIQLQRNGVTITSGTFVINQQPNIYLDSIVQCPGYIRIDWDSVAQASGYQILMKKGPYMQVVDTVTANVRSYTFSGLFLDSNYYVAVCPKINGNVGYRSLAVSRVPNTGTCAGSISNGDLMIEKVLSPSTGRFLTSTQHTTHDTLTVRIRNLDDVVAGNYKVSYSINGGVWQSQIFTNPIAANSNILVKVSGLNLANVGFYTINIAIQNLAINDPVKSNDSITILVQQLDNPLVVLAPSYTDSFESMTIMNILNDSIGISPNGHWDYSRSTDTGHLRTWVNNDITISGNRSISLDASQYVPDNTNYLTGTFNLNNNDTNNEVRLDFDYKLHGKPKYASGNEVWVRGTDTAQWVSVYHYDTITSAGVINHSISISITDALRQYSQNFSSSMQVRFGQRDTSLIASNNYGNGLTLDNVKLYVVQNDVQLLSVLSPNMVGCNWGNNEPVTIQVRNGVSQTQQHIHLFYQYDNGTVYEDSIASIAGKVTVQHTFAQRILVPSLGTHTLSVWLYVAGDTYRSNDSLLNMEYRNEPLITSFPYLQNFESGDGYWFAGGQNSSWQFGTPASVKIHKAASGINAWKTKLIGNYNNLEYSFLYSPCFDISSLTNPMLSFSVAIDVENCGSILCDAVYVEYSLDGNLWTKLGTAGSGTNWYNDVNDQLWSIENDTRWHVASTYLPASILPIRLRFVMKSDPGVNFEGVAIDDIHIFDRTSAIYEGNATPNITQSVLGTTWTTFTSTGGLITEIHPKDQNLGNTSVVLYKPSIRNSSDSGQYNIARSYTVKPKTQPNDSVSIRLYVLDSEVLSVINDTNCISCTKPEDAYTLGVTQYSDPYPDNENGTLIDNLKGVYTYYPYNMISWVPYDNGYYAELSVRSFCELWLNDGGPTHNFALSNPYIDFTAKKEDFTHAILDWKSNIDTVVSLYEIQRSYNDSNFTTINTTTSAFHAPQEYVYTDNVNISIGGVVYYRLISHLNDGGILYSATKRIDWTEPYQLFNIYPNPNRDGILYIKWSAYIGTVLDVSMVNMTGKLIFNTSLKSADWNNVTSMQIPHLPTGVYFLKVNIGSNIFVKKLLIE
ncbi:MAG: S8/S53 family peptidase [Bacteroidota bacterium]